MTPKTSVLKPIEEDQQRQRDLLDKISQTQGDSENRRTLFEELTSELKSQAAAEEQSLFAEMIDKPQADDETRHSIAEHQEIDEMHNDRPAADMGSPELMPKLKEFDHRYRHRINEEEEDHFLDFEDLIDEEADKRLTKVFEERKEIEKAEAEIAPVSADGAKEWLTRARSIARRSANSMPCAYPL